MFDDGERSKPPCLAAKEPRGGIRECDTRGNLQVRKFPKVRIDDAGWTLLHKPSTFALYEKGGESAGGSGRALVEVREFFNPAGLAGLALAPNGTFTTARLPGSADKRAEFHEGLVDGGTSAGN